MNLEILKKKKKEGEEEEGKVVLCGSLEMFPYSKYFHKSFLMYYISWVTTNLQDFVLSS